MIEQRNTPATGLSNFHLDPSKPVKLVNPAPELGHCLIAYFLFETNVGRGKGIVNLTPADDSGHSWKAFTFYTPLQELKGFEERKGNRRPTGVNSGAHRRGKNWLDERNEGQNMEGIEPTVLVIGSGHSGLNVAARLGMLDVRTLVIERNQRVGDNWRKRYKSYKSPRLYEEGLTFY